MTGEKAKTLIERFGFKDEDLTTPEHDKILLWLLNPKNTLKMLKQLNLLKEHSSVKITCDCCKPCSWKWLDIGDWPNGECSGVEKEATQQNLLEIQKLHKKEDVFLQIIGIKGEHQILGYNNFNIGSVDVKVSLSSSIEGLYKTHKGCSFTYQILKLDEEGKQKSEEYFIEIKPKVKSIGELLRQINLYRSHEENGIWIVVTETTGLKEILKTQDIYTYEITKEILGESI